jgi:PKD repeat protein
MLGAIGACGLVAVVAGCARAPAPPRPPEPAVAVPGDAKPSGGLLDPDVLIVDVDAEPMFGDAPLTVRFTADVWDETDEPRYAWRFGDDEAASAEQYPVHRYDRPGAYTATVTVRDASGRTGTGEVDVQVFETGR